MSLVLFLSWSATIATVGFFLSGILTCQKMMQSGSAENVPLLPFVTTFLNCMVWASYGVVKGDDALVPVNVIGMITQVLFTLCFFLYCKERGKEVKAVVYAAVLACSLYMYVVHFLSNDQTRVRHLGLICIVLTITMQASPLATVAKVVQTRSTESMPFIFSFMMVLVSFLWLSYGTVVEDINIQVPNATGVFLGLLQLSLFCIYPSKPSVNVKL
ncbi:PREDICTED: sugar transporter SWEET1-like [Acropora digitifera]|uniref:sugar transporter SWEET1-like n=1 Tax=Acropora digitifera TaxID=70779 RepID=UPI00077A0D96|nr:PREDICTED: sugar transporter SWEET1-like [Acropora digitifera]